MRGHGFVSSASGLGPFPHLAWTYRDRSQFWARAAEYIADAVQQNQRAEYVGDGDRAALHAEVAAMPGLEDRLASGQVCVTPVQDFYSFCPRSDLVDAEAAVAGYAAATQRAVDDGYAGYRSIVDATTMVCSAEQRAAFAGCECQVDQQMTMLPCSALCCYDVTRLGDAAAELVCLHPFAEQGAAMFRCYTGSGGGVRLDGEIDTSTGELFATTLQRVWPLAAGNRLQLDAADLGFIGHKQLLILDQYARAGDREIVLRTNQPIPLRVAGLVDLTNVRVESAMKSSVVAS